MKLGPTKVAATATAAALVLAACGGTESDGASGAGSETADGETAAGESDARGEELVLAARVEPNSYDSAHAHVGHSLIWFQSVYDTLLHRDTSGELNPMLATDWEYNEDQTVLTLNLRDDVTFSDGEEFNAEAAAANLEHFQTANGQQESQLSSVTDVVAADEYTVEVHLSEPDPAVEFYLSQAAGMMGSPAAIGTPEMENEPVGSGPYTLVTDETVPGSQYVYEAREDYWNPEMQHWGRLELHPATDFNAVLNGLVAGQFDGAMLDPQTAGQADDAGLTLVPNEVDWQGLALFDREGEVVPGLEDVRVRQAINHAIDRETLLEQIVDGRGTVTEQVLTPDSEGYLPEAEGYYEYDPERARDLLEEAGYADDVTLQAPIGAGFEALLPALAQQFEDVGITLEQVPVPQENFASNIREGQYPSAAFNFAMSATPWISANYVAAPDADFNPFGVEDPELSDMIAELRTAGDDIEEPAQAISQYLLEEAWFAPIYRLEQPYYVNSDVVTVEPMPNQAAPSVYDYTPAD